MPSTTMPLAHKVPNELLDHIAREACRMHYWEGEGTHEDAFTLTNLCLVQYRWAIICRPQLWERIFITSERRLRSLCSLLAPPSLPSLQAIASFIQVCYLTPTFGNHDNPPWLHRAHKSLSSRLLASTQFSVHIQRSGISTTLHPYLPYTLPAKHLPIVHLQLIDIELESRGALLKLLASTPSLEYVLCSHVKWINDEPPSPSIVLNSRLRDIAVDATSTDAVWWLLPPLVGHRCRPKSRPTGGARNLRSLIQADCDEVSAMVTSMQSSLSFLAASITRYDHSRRTECPYISMEFDLARPPGDDPSQIYFSFDIHYAEEQILGTSHDAGVDWPATRCTVQFVYIHIRDDAASWDKYWTPDTWTSFARHTLGLSELQRLLFCFTTHRQMHEFITRYGPALRLGDLSHRVSFGDDVCWVYGSEPNRVISSVCQE